MSDLVRARIGGLEKNVGREYAEELGLEILDEETHRDDGQLRETTRKGGRPLLEETTVDAAAAKKTAAKKATAKKTAATRRRAASTTGSTDQADPNPKAGTESASTSQEGSK